MRVRRTMFVLRKWLLMTLIEINTIEQFKAARALMTLLWKLDIESSNNLDSAIFDRYDLCMDCDELVEDCRCMPSRKR
jgi:hypothetical protein